MHGEKNSRSLSVPSQSKLTDEISTSTLTELACLPIGCSVSAKYRGAFCTAQVKTIEKQVKLKVTLIDSGDTITISDEQVVNPVSLRIGTTITIRLPSTRHHSIDSNAYLSRSGLAAIISTNNTDEKQATIRQIIDNSTYTVVFNDGDEKSLRRSSLCLQGIRLYQTQMTRQKIPDEIPTTSIPTTDINDITSIVAVQRNNNSKNQDVFPALILKRQALADYMWVKSFLDGREYIVHKRDDVQSYKNNSVMQSLCRLTSKQATKACDKFIKYNQIPVIWQKKKKKQLNTVDNTSDSDSNASESDVDNSDDKTIEEKDSFVAQLFAFMDDRGTPINNIPKVHNYDLDLHRLFKIVRLYGGYNKVTKNNQWNKVHIKMGLPNESPTENGRSIENAYKKYLFAYEDLSKKLGTMNSSSSYFGGRTGTSSDSRRSLIRVRQEPEEKIKLKQHSRKISSSSSAAISRRKTIVINKIKSLETSDDESSSSSSNYDNNKMKKQQITSPKKINPVSSFINNKSNKKSAVTSNEKKKMTRTKSLSQERLTSTLVKKTKPTMDDENNMRPIIKIAKISYEILKESAPSIDRFSKKQTSTKISKTQDNTSNSEQQQSEAQIAFPTVSEPNNPTILHDMTPLAVTPVSPSPPPSINREPTTPPLPCITTQNTSFSYDNISETKELESPSIFQSITKTDNLPSNSNTRLYSDENSQFIYKIDEQLSPSKRSICSVSSETSSETISTEQLGTNSTSINNCNNQLTFEDIQVNDVLLVRWELNRKKQYYAKCIEKNDHKKELHVHYKGWNSNRHDEWIKLDRVIKRKDEIDSNEEEIVIDISSSFTLNGDNEQHKSSKIEENKRISSDFDNGIWKDLEKSSSVEDNTVSYSSTNHTKYHPMYVLPSSPTEYNIDLQRTTSTNNIASRYIGREFQSIGDHIPQAIPPNRRSTRINSTSSFNVDDILSTSNILIHPLHFRDEISDNSSLIRQSVPIIIETITLPDNRRASIRQLKRRTFRDSSIPAKKRTKLDTDINSNSNVDSINNSDPRRNSIEQQTVETKRYRTVGKRGGKKSVIPQDNENDDLNSNSPLNGTLRQQLDDMFKHRSSRYNFLDLNSSLTGDNRLIHLKDRMRQCQKVFFNLKSALNKIEKQRQIFLRRQQQPIIVQTTTSEILLPSTCI